MRIKNNFCCRSSDISLWQYGYLYICSGKERGPILIEALASQTKLNSLTSVSNLRSNYGFITFSVMTLVSQYPCLALLILASEPRRLDEGSMNKSSFSIAF